MKPNKEALIEEIKASRANDYGSFKKVAEVTHGLIKALNCGDNWCELDDVTRLAFFMICNKMARAVNGRLTKDTILDIQGYASLILDESLQVVEATKENSKE